jgi:hypothetical protein
VVNLRLDLTGVKVQRRRYNVWEFANVSFAPAFEIEVQPGRSYRPKVIFSMAIKAPIKDFESLIARSVNRKIQRIKSQLGIAPCPSKFHSSDPPVVRRKR